jgi:hypothetical protein
MKIKLEVLYNEAHVQTREFIRPIMANIFKRKQGTGIDGDSSQETTPVLRFFSLTQNKLEKKDPTFKSQEACAHFLLWKETVMCRINLGTILCNLPHPTKKHDLDKFTLTPNEIT